MRRCFQALPPERQAEEVRQAIERVVFAAPGLFPPVPEALLEARNRLGEEAVTVVLDCDDEVCRLGLGDFGAIKTLKEGGVTLRQSPGLRMGVLICDQKAWAFAPPVLCVEKESRKNDQPNAVLLTPQTAQALVEAISPSQNSFVDPLPEIGTQELDEMTVKRTENSLKERPPQKFEISRLVRVYQSHFQYVEVHLLGLAINRRQVTLPKSLVKLTGDKDLEARLRTTFNLIEKKSELSDKTIREKLDKLLKDMAPSLGKPWGRVILRRYRAEFDKKIAELRQEIKAHQKRVEQEIKEHIDSSIVRIAKVFAKIVNENQPEKLRYRFDGEMTDSLAESWLIQELTNAFPKPNNIVQEMKLEVHFRDVTYETLNNPDFIKVLKKEFPMIDWPYVEYEAAQAKENL